MNILGQMVNGGVEVNGIAVPEFSLRRVLGRFVHNLWVINPDYPQFPLSLPGSATAVRVNGHEYLLATQHQLSGHERESVAMVLDNGEFFVTAAGARWPPRDGSDANDIVAFDFTEPCEAHPQLKQLFFDLGPPQPLSTERPVPSFVVSGFPSERQDVEFERRHINVARLTAYCELDEPPSDETLLKLRLSTPLDLVLDGMSGGGAFAIEVQDGRLQARFAGILVRGGNSQLYVLKSAIIRNLLATWPHDAPGVETPGSVM